MEILSKILTTISKLYSRVCSFNCFHSAVFAAAAFLMSPLAVLLPHLSLALFAVSSLSFSEFSAPVLVSIAAVSLTTVSLVAQSPSLEDNHL
jgi:hypothetical protein